MFKCICMCVYVSVYACVCDCECVYENVCACLYVYACTCECMYVGGEVGARLGSAWVCGDQMSASGVTPQAQLPLFPCQDLPQEPSSPIRLGWLASNPHIAICLYCLLL